MMHMDEALRRLEENEGYQEIVENMSEGSEEDVQHNVQDYVAGIQKLSWLNKERWSTWKVESGGQLKRGETEGAKSKNNGGRTRENNGGRESKGRTQDRSKASKASQCVLVKGGTVTGDASEEDS